MNYETASDFEINKAVAEIVKKNLAGFRIVGRNGDACVINEYFYTGEDEVPYDPCNNPSDAWPIIEQLFEMGVTLAINGTGINTSNLGKLYKDMYIEVEAPPLRAAMICFLKMVRHEGD